MSEHDDYLAGLAGGGRRDSSAFRAGEARRHQKEMDPIIREIMTPKTVVPEAASPHYLDQPATSQHAGAGTYEPGTFDAWDRSPGLSFLTFIVAVAVSWAIISPALDAIGLPGVAAWLAAVVAHNDYFAETAGYWPRIMLLGGASLALSTWTKALPFAFGTGLLLLFIRHFLLG